MSADDSLLGQATVDFREEERRWRNTCPAAIPLSGGSPRVGGRPNSPIQAGTVAGLPTDEQTSFCTRSPSCQAAPNAHADDCPVEAELRNEFGY